MRASLNCFLIVGLQLSAFVGQTSACPFCDPTMGKPLADRMVEADMAFVGRMTNPRIVESDPAAVGLAMGETDCEILKVIKSHPAIEGKESIILPRYIPVFDSTNPADYVVLANVLKDGELDPFEGLPVDDGEFIQYSVEAAKKTLAKPEEKLAFFFRHLDHPNKSIAQDAYKVFAITPYKDVVAAKAGYDPDLILKWIEAREPTYRLGLLGCLLGICGRPGDAAVLRSTIEQSATDSLLVGVDGLMGGYCLLDPAGGVEFVAGLLRNPESDFNTRFAALRTMKFLLNDVPSIPREQVVEALRTSIAVRDIGDLVVDELRKAEAWDTLDEVLALWEKEGYRGQHYYRSILRFALECPSPRAAEFVAQVRAKDPRQVADVEELLRLEKRQREAQKPKT